MKISKRTYLTVVQSDPSPRETHWRDPDKGPICTSHQYFRLQSKHLKGSTRPAGWFHKNSSFDSTVEIRWLSTNDLGFFAPEITFRPTNTGIIIAKKVGKALNSFGYREDNPDALADLLKAAVVEYVDDNKDGCWDDYRPLRIPGEPAMVTLARQAQ